MTSKKHFPEWEEDEDGPQSMSPEDWMAALDRLLSEPRATTAMTEMRRSAARSRKPSMTGTTFTEELVLEDLCDEAEKLLPDGWKALTSEQRDTLILRLRDEWMPGYPPPAPDRLIPVIKELGLEPTVDHLRIWDPPGATDTPDEFL